MSAETLPESIGWRRGTHGVPGQLSETTCGSSALVAADAK